MLPKSLRRILVVVAGSRGCLVAMSSFRYPPSERPRGAGPQPGVCLPLRFTHKRAMEDARA